MTTPLENALQLHEELRLVIQERLEKARALEEAFPGPWDARREVIEDLHFGHKESTILDSAGSNIFALGHMPLELAEFMRAYNPTSVRRILESELRLLDLHRTGLYKSDECTYCMNDMEETPFPCNDILELIERLGITTPE